MIKYFIIILLIVILSCNNIVNDPDNIGYMNLLQFSLSKGSNPTISILYSDLRGTAGQERSNSLYELLSFSSEGRVNWKHSFEGKSQDPYNGVLIDQDRAGSLLLAEIDTRNPSQYSLISQNGKTSWIRKEDKEHFKNASLSVTYSFVGMSNDVITILYSLFASYNADEAIESDYYTKLYQFNKTGETLSSYSYHRNGTINLTQSENGHNFYLAVDNYSNNGFWVEDDHAEVDNGILIHKLDINLKPHWSINISKLRLNGAVIMPEIMKSNTDGGLLTLFNKTNVGLIILFNESGEIVAEATLNLERDDNIQIIFDNGNNVLISNGINLRKFDQKLNESWHYEADESDTILDVNAHDDIFLVSGNNLVKLSTNGEEIFTLSLNDGFQKLEEQEALDVRAYEMEIGDDNNLYFLLAKATTINGKAKWEDVLQNRSPDGDILWNRVIVLK